MQRNFRFVAALFFISIVLCYTSCTKIDTTSLGQDLIPAIDNVNTFADTLEVIGEQGIFLTDSTIIGKSDLHPVGNIATDPVFGKASANLYVQLKPSFYPYYFGKAGDSIVNGIAGTGFDSAVLCFSYKGYYGDSTKPQHFTVYLIDPANTNFKRDTSYPLSFTPNGGVNGLGQEIGRAVVDPRTIRNYTYLNNGTTKKDSVNNQIRIPLSQSFLNDFVRNWDTTRGGNSMYLSDSLFHTRIKGFAVVPDQSEGNGFFYVNVLEANTRLEVHYRASNRGKLDTNYTKLAFINASNATITGSAHASSLTRDRSGAEYNPSQPTSDVLYLQTTPGTYATLKINGLNNFPNSIIHRAELFIEQAGPITSIDNALLPPAFLYLDLHDTAIRSNNPYKPIYYDLNPAATYFPDISTSTIFFPTSGMDTGYFGGARYSRDEAGGKRHFYRFNISRYVQKIVTNGEKNYPLRIWAPYDLNYYRYTLPFRNNIGAGRVKVGNGNNPNPAYRMGLRLVYSKI